MAGKSFALFPVKYSDPTAVASELRMILVPAGSGAAANLIQVEAVDRMSAILVITSQPAYLDRAREWISQLDHGDETMQRRLYVRYVQNGRAVELARVLRQALGISGGGGSQDASNPVAPGMVQSTVSSPAMGGGQGGGFGGGQGGGTPTLGGSAAGGLSGASNSGAIGQGNQAEPRRLPGDRRLCRSGARQCDRRHGRYGLERFRRRQHRHQWRRRTRSIADRIGCAQQRLDHLCQPQGIRADRSGDAAPRCGAAAGADRGHHRRGDPQQPAAIRPAMVLQFRGQQLRLHHPDLGGGVLGLPRLQLCAERHQRQGRAERAHPDHPGQGDLLARAAGAGQRHRPSPGRRPGADHHTVRRLGDQPRRAGGQFGGLPQHRRSSSTSRRGSAPAGWSFWTSTRR